MHTLIFLKRRRDESGSVCRHKAWLLICRNEERNCREEIFFPVTYCAILGLVLCLYIQQGWKIRQIDLENTFQNWRFKRSVYVMLPKHMFPEASKLGMVMNLKKSLYEFERRCQGVEQIPLQNDNRPVFGRVKTGPYVLVKEGLPILCYVDNLIMLPRKESDIDDVKGGLNNKFRLQNMGNPSIPS